MVRSRAQVPVEAGGNLVEPLAVGGIEPGARVGLAGIQHRLTRQQELAAAEDPAAGVDLLREMAVVARERGVHAPDLAVAETEPRAPGVQHMGGIGPGAAPTVLAQVGADGEGAALRGALLGPAAGEVQQLIGVAGHGDGDGELLQRVRNVCGVRAGGALAQEARREQLDLEGDLEPELLVGQIGAHQRCTGLGMRGGQQVAVEGDRVRDQARRPSGVVGP